MPVIVYNGTILETITSSMLGICNYALLMIGESSITQTQLDNESTRPAQLCATFYPYIRNQVLEAHHWNFAEKHRLLDYTDDFGIYPDDGTDNDVLTITSATQANPVVLSVASHPYVDGNLVYVYDVGGMTEINNKVFEIADVDGDSFELVGVDGTKYTAYTSGGSCIRKEVETQYSNGYTYTVPSDCLYPIRIDDGTNGPGPDFIRISTSYNERILTAQKDAVLIYTAEITEADYYPARFINAFAARLAMQLVIPLKKKGADLDKITAFYQLNLNQGTLADFRENRKTPNTTDSWMTDAGFIQ